MASKGYYSLIQYCPDRSRLEGANIGVVLFCPERRFLQARLSNGNDRLRRFFGAGSFDPSALAAAKRAIAARLQTVSRFTPSKSWTTSSRPERTL